MPCYHPIDAWRSRVVNSSGKRSIVFNIKLGFVDMPVTIRCGQCIGCRLDYSRQWAVRCVHEASLYDRSAFITITFDDKHLPVDRSITVRDLQLFFKRLRKAISPLRIRYFACGEYGEERNRPHYHACIFGYDFPDKLPVCTNDNGDILYTSPLLSVVWPFGFNWIGNVTFESAAYVARYIMKKHKGKDSPDEYELIDKDTGEVHFQTKEFVVMSRGGKDAATGKNAGGIGSKWFELYSSDTDKDFITLRGVKMSLPKFYDLMLEVKDPDSFAIRKGLRVQKAKKNAIDNTIDRLNAKEEFVNAKLSFLKRDKE